MTSPKFLSFSRKIFSRILTQNDLFSGEASMPSPQMSFHYIIQKNSRTVYKDVAKISSEKVFPAIYLRNFQHHFQRNCHDFSRRSHRYFVQKLLMASQENFCNFYFVFFFLFIFIFFHSHFFVLQKVFLRLLKTFCREVAKNFVSIPGFFFQNFPRKLDCNFTEQFS